ncbi:DUF2095 family protein [Candidatus Bathyarchaeota archaeon]|nr:DUF2095 family protein [Candidatus Bathyarchaeota archaeon]
MRSSKRMEMNWKTFRKRFPHLAKELESGAQTVRIGGVRSYEAEGFDELRMPDAVSYLRRCETEEQALEIIEYLERKGKISKDYAESLRKQLREKGVRSFGPLKKPGYYLRRYYYGVEE